MCQLNLLNNLSQGLTLVSKRQILRYCLLVSLLSNIYKILNSWGDLVLNPAFMFTSSPPSSTRSMPSPWPAPSLWLWVSTSSSSPTSSSSSDENKSNKVGVAVERYIAVYHPLYYNKVGISSEIYSNVTETTLFNNNLLFKKIVSVTFELLTRHILVGGLS